MKALKAIWQYIKWTVSFLYDSLLLGAQALFVVAYVVIAVCVTVLSGCASATPTRVPPLAEKLGYEIPNWKGWTTTGLNEGTYKVEYEKLKVLRIMVNVVNEPALLAREKGIDWLNVGLAGGMFGGIPLALKCLPKGAVKKEDHEEIVKKAGNQHPDDFNA